jgi:hypothetical protein
MLNNYLTSEREQYLLEAAILAIIASSNTEEVMHINLPSSREQQPLEAPYGRHIQ